jgi:hypothetical protein
MTLSERQKMLSGELYDCKDPELVNLRFRARRLWLYNTSTEDRRQELLGEILGHLGPGVWIEPPFYFDYGSFIELRDKVYPNVNCVIPGLNRVGDQNDARSFAADLCGLSSAGRGRALRGTRIRGAGDHQPDSSLGYQTPTEFGAACAASAPATPAPPVACENKCIVTPTHAFITGGTENQGWSGAPHF